MIIPNIKSLSWLFVGIVKENDMKKIGFTGTWSTYRYTKRVKKPIILFLPDGSVKEENYDSNLPK